MTERESTLRAALRKAQAKHESDGIPDFDSVWAAAEREAGAALRRRGIFAGVAVVAAAVVLAVGVLPMNLSPTNRLPTKQQDLRYIDTDELLETTRWSAPSDSLLPEHQFDIYQEIPVLIESTETYGGALL